LSRLIRIIDRVSDVTGNAIAWLTVAMMVLTCATVTARYVLNLGSVALQESVMYLHGIVFMLAIGYTLRHDGHVRVDVLSNRFSRRTRAIIELAGTTVFLVPIAVFVFWSSLGYVSFSWSLHEGSAQPGGLPGVYLLKTLIPVMALLLLLQGIAEGLRAIVIIRDAA